MTSVLDSHDWKALVTAMLVDPDDDTLRLVMADWLEEHGGSEALSALAAFIRLQVEGARHERRHVYGESCDCGACRCERQAVALFDQWGHLWMQSPLKSYVRGFADEPLQSQYVLGGEG